ncbi:MAG: ABC transporter substrate-binding protein, partial [Thermodesulfobacteriota bacterium]|nr:ABC transporter substrate-binding protein [Thermodesulfobacteriota bacterium]
MNGLLKLRNMAVSILTFGTIWVGITTLASAEKHVVYLRLSDYSGPIAGIDIPQATGTKYYFQYINDQGGIDGVKIKLIAPDVRYNVARAVSAYNRYRKEKKLLLCVGGGTGIAKAVGRVARGDKIVLAYPADGEIQ